MSDFKANMHKKIDFGWGSGPDPSGGAYSAPPDSLTVFNRPTTKGWERGKKRGRGGKEEGKGRSSSSS